MIAPDSLLRAMLAKSSASHVCRTLTEQGYETTRSRCEVIRGRMLLVGEAEPLPRYDEGGDIFPTIGDPASSAKASCDNLLRAHLRHGHWLTDGERFAAACESVGLAA